MYAAYVTVWKPWVAHAVMLMNTKKGSTNANPRNTPTIMAPFSFSQPESARKPAPKNNTAERTTLNAIGKSRAITMVPRTREASWCSL
jgi:hypothetical protein